MRPLKVKIPGALMTPERGRRIRIALSAGLGRRPDVDVALDIGSSIVTVARYRRILGLGHTVEAIRDAVRHGVVYAKTDGQLAAGIRRFARRGHSRMAIALRMHASPERILRLAKANGIALPKFRCGPRRGSSRAAQRRTLPPGEAVLPTRAARRWRAYLDATYGGRARGVDWMQRDERLARRIGVGVRTVREWRRRLRLRGLAIPPQPHPWIRKPDWRQVDWSLPNAKIARQFNVGTRTVTQWRKEFRERGHAVPPAPNPQRQAWLRMAESVVPRIRDLARKGLCQQAIARRLCIDHHAVARLAEWAGIRIAPHRTPVD